MNHPNPILFVTPLHCRNSAAIDVWLTALVGAAVAVLAPHPRRPLLPAPALGCMGI